jgi:thiosulfate sulfurtransferase
MSASFTHLSVSELQSLMIEKQQVIVDIRDQASYLQGHIKGAILLSNDNLADFIREADIDEKVIVCCYHGNSSQQAAQFLVTQDFTQVYSLDGGFSQWQLKYPTEIEK